MPDETGVVNAALKLIGGTRITSLDDGTTNANHAVEIYADLRDDLLRAHDWNFASTRVKLAQMVMAPAFEFDHAYALPADWLRTVSVHNNEAGTGTFVYRMEHVGDQRAIVTSADDVWLRYVFREEDPNIWAADFVKAVELALASDLAIPVASSNSMAQLYGVRAERKLAQARSSDAMGSFPERRPRGSWANSRGGRYRVGGFASS